MKGKRNLIAHSTREKDVFLVSATDVRLYRCDYQLAQRNTIQRIVHSAKADWERQKSKISSSTSENSAFQLISIIPNVQRPVSVSWSEAFQYTPHVVASCMGDERVIISVPQSIDPEGNLSSTVLLNSSSRMRSVACQFNPVFTSWIAAGYSRSRPDPNIVIWDLQRAPLSVKRDGLSKSPSSSSMSSSSSLGVMAGKFEGTGKSTVYEERPVHSFQAEDTRSMAWLSKDPFSLVIGSEKSIKLFDVRSGKKTIRLESSGNQMRNVSSLSCVLSHDSDIVVAGCDDGIRVWDLRNPDEPLSVFDMRRGKFSHVQWVESLFGSHYVASLRNEKKSIQLWRVEAAESSDTSKSGTSGFERHAQHPALYASDTLHDFTFHPSTPEQILAVDHLGIVNVMSLARPKPLAFSCAGSLAVASDKPRDKDSTSTFAKSVEPHHHSTENEITIFDFLRDFKPSKGLSFVCGGMDIGTRMEQRARAGYGLDAELNLSILQSDEKAPRTLWEFALRLSTCFKRSNIAKKRLQEHHFLAIEGLLSKERPVPFQRAAADSEGCCKEFRNALVQPRYNACYQLIGWCDTLWTKEQYEKSIFRAIMLGNIRRAVDMLGEKIEQLEALTVPKKKEDLLGYKLLSVALGSYHTTSQEVFSRVFGSIVGSISDPYIRTATTFLSQAGSNVQDVLRNSKLCLRDRLGVALTFLGDEELKETLELFKEQAIANMDLECLYIVGLGKEGQDLIHTYMERTGDIQSVVLFAFSCAPFHEVLFSQYPKWAHVYNTLLDRWMLWSIHIRGITGHVTGQEISLECRTCWKTAKRGSKNALDDHPMGIGKSSSLSSSAPAPSYEQSQTGRTDICRHCKNPYPLCSVCQMPLGSPVVDKHAEGERPLPEDEMNHWFTWCQRCKHGGHVGHLRDWFRMSDVCPVKGCECCCQALDHVIE
eukprot:TRINITY_DN10356_c0_g2_i1.p1 TRINITY_DN10356_c0_g2~~TRINITY_DN10356_c0_g2_i1.p1  ORF type:complete len:932 (-),score=226.96 TRINITY_DN10356_c0_g2_i1:4-2799(-)